MSKKVDIENFQDRASLLVQVIKQTMKTTGIGIDFDLGEKKLALIDIKSKMMIRISLEEINDMFIKREE